MNILGIIGSCIYLYLIWRNLRDDYKNEDLVSYSWLSLLAFLVGGRLMFGIVNWGVWNENWLNWLSFWNKPGFNYVGAIIGWILLTVGYCRNFGWKMWSLFEDVIGIMYIYLALMMLAEAVANRFSLFWITLMMVWLIALALKRMVITRYRSFAWYASGKKGFAFFFANVFLGILLVAWFYLVARAGIILSVLPLSISLFSVAGLLVLGEIGGKK